MLKCKMQSILVIIIAVLLTSAVYGDDLSLSNSTASAVVNNPNNQPPKSSSDNIQNLTVQPEMAQPSHFPSPQEVNNQKNDNTVDVLITPPKNELGGSLHQNNELKKYLGINY